MMHNEQHIEELAQQLVDMVLEEHREPQEPIQEHCEFIQELVESIQEPREQIEFHKQQEAPHTMATLTDQEEFAELTQPEESIQEEIQEDVQETIQEEPFHEESKVPPETTQETVREQSGQIAPISIPEKTITPTVLVSATESVSAELLSPHVPPPPTNTPISPLLPDQPVPEQRQEQPQKQIVEQKPPEHVYQKAPQHIHEKNSALIHSLHAQPVQPIAASNTTMTQEQPQRLPQQNQQNQNEQQQMLPQMEIPARSSLLYSRPVANYQQYQFFHPYQVAYAPSPTPSQTHPSIQMYPQGNPQMQTHARPPPNPLAPMHTNQPTFVPLNMTATNSFGYYQQVHSPAPSSIMSIPHMPPTAPSIAPSIAASNLRYDSDTASIHSETTASHALNSQTPDGVSLEALRQKALKSKDPELHLELAKRLIEASQALPSRLANESPKKIRRSQNYLNQESIRWLSKAAAGPGYGKPGNPEALYLLADCYGNGSLGLSIDHDRAFTYYSQAAKQSHPQATYKTALSYEVGAGTRRDPTRAVQYYRKAAALGDTAAMYKLGTIQLHGSLGVTQNPREGVNWLKRAAAQSDENTAYAIHELALLYEGNVPGLSHVVIPDHSYAHDLFLKSARLGYAPSQYKLGLCHEYGNLGLPVDPRRSIAWYSRAAEKGDPEAELALSGWYLTGSESILQQSDREAYLWARKAGDKGLAKAEYAVGYFLENGIGVPCDVDEARRWYMRSASQGNKRAMQRLNELNENGDRPSYAAVSSAGSRGRDFRKESDARNGDCSIM